ncbi:hypothetical protein [Novosphingobium album (ex Hu et al. 2023)]|uniref:DUF2892 domain-containing protein n=1 Tax=Novosphingobium album (ex Hu et al. 2023) TaxID=2930093 RepID=A0ABT0AZ92_9SPHN|nr:hypothetical protein [Novosphingobium album (ex Hu et al. 2023)]MCJ2177869.1 hypothetical protein [Novosphingobium album (ex Hu et al. 2023)]
MRLTTVEMIRVWAAMTGLFLVALYFGVLSTGSMPSPMIAMLATAIGGFEIFFFGQDQWLKRRGKHG